MAQLVHRGTPSQPRKIAVRLALQDELRSLRFNLQHGAQWLLDDVGGGVAKRFELQPSDALSAPLGTLQRMVGTTAQQALTGLQSAQHAAASAVLADAPYRTLDFKLEPLLAYFSAKDIHHPSRLFTDVFYWLMRHVLEGKVITDAELAGTPLMARQRAVDDAYWLVTDTHQELLNRLHREAGLASSGLLRPDDNAMLCAAVFQALRATQPVRDPSLPPWAERALPEVDAPAVTHCLLTAVLAAGLARTQCGETRDTSVALQLAHQLSAARFASFRVAMNKPDAEAAVATEIAFVLRHA